MDAVTRAGVKTPVFVQSAATLSLHPEGLAFTLHTEMRRLPAGEVWPADAESLTGVSPSECQLHTPCRETQT